MHKIGIIGQGYVGTAVREIMSNYYEIQTFDIDEKKSDTSSISELVTNNDIIFVCVPTPMKKDGSCDTSIVEDVVEKINFVGKDDTLVVIKSTIPPGTTNKLNKKYNYLSVVFNPEFLTEANFIEDFKNQDRIIIGGPRPATSIMKMIYSKAFPNAHIIKTGSITAEMVKYTTNTFLATKVSFANEIKMVCDKLNIDYDKVVEYAVHDERLGKSHWAVPGPDGKLGFGGSCFPKDLNALIKLSEDFGMYLTTLNGVWHTNLKVRPEEDWKELIGRAVTEE